MWSKQVSTNANADGIFISSLSADGSAIEDDKIQIGEFLNYKTNSLIKHGVVYEWCDNLHLFLSI